MWIFRNDELAEQPIVADQAFLDDVAELQLLRNQIA